MRCVIGMAPRLNGGGREPTSIAAQDFDHSDTWQRTIVRAAMLGMPGGAEIVAATDADQAGGQLANGLREIFNDCGRADLTFRRDEPIGGKDWNELLQRQARRYALDRLNTARPG